MLRLNIKTKVLAAFMALAAIPIFVTSLVIDNRANSAATEALEEQVRNRLLATREIKKDQIEDYFATLLTSLRSLSVDRITVQNARAFASNFAEAARKPDADQRRRVAAFYRETFARAYAGRHGVPLADPEALFQALDDAAIAMQDTYIAANGNKLDEKHDLQDPDDGTQYGYEHGERHSSLLRNLEKFGLADLYIVDPKGRVVYSARKRIDFGTDLARGPFKASGLARAHFAAMKGDNYDVVAMADFESYLPAFGAPAAFLASPIQDVEEPDDFEFLGTLVFRIPVDRINAILTGRGRWAGMGLGQTGEIYLVGTDKRMRSVARSAVEDTAAFVQALADAGVDERTRRIVATRRETATVLALDTPYVAAALRGETGIGEFTGLLGPPVLAAYAPLEIMPGVRWAMVSEIGSDEAFAARTGLAADIRVAAVAVALIMIALASGAGYFFANTLTRPLVRLAGVIGEIERDSDLTRRIDVRSRDAIGRMGEALNRLLEKFHHSMTEVAAATTQVANSAEEMSAVTSETSAGVARQFDQIDQMATAINEMSATVQEVARHAGEAAQAANAADEEARNGNATVSRTVDVIDAVAGEMQQAVEVIERLARESEDIGAVMDVIRNIAEQTNLLALNAAIEAARAGDQGRGFAVVADEVRTLAGRTQQSTVEIEQMIEKLQAGARDAVAVIGQGREKTEEAVAQAAEAGKALETITRSVNTISEMNTMIASAADEQRSVTEEINRNVVTITQVAEQTTEHAAQTSSAAGELSQLAARLQELVARFRT